LTDSFLTEGLILEKEITTGCPTKMENCRVMVANTPMDYDKIKIHALKANVDSIDTMAEIEEAEKSKMANKVNKILAFKPTVFINR
jgi:T-complex protein 1 subunit beta